MTTTVQVSYGNSLQRAFLIQKAVEKFFALQLTGDVIEFVEKEIESKISRLDLEEVFIFDLCNEIISA
jgi:hypothetical protein